MQQKKAVQLLQSACRGHQCVTRHNKALQAIQGPSVIIIPGAAQDLSCFLCMHLCSSIAVC